MNVGQILRTRKAVFLTAIVMLVVVWSITSRLFDLGGTISSPAMVLFYIQDLVDTGEWIEPLLITTRRVILAFIVTLIVGTVVGVAIGLSNYWEKALQDYITIGLAFPSLFIVIFSAMWFGFSDTTAVVAGSLISFPYLSTNIHSALNDLDRELIDMSSSFNISRRRILRRVVVHSILPDWFSGARFAFAICWKITTLAEIVAAGNGIGYEIGISMQTLSLTGVLGWTLVFTAVMLVIEYGGFQQIQKRVFAWRQEGEIQFI